jgi:hypothetical protein
MATVWQQFGNIDQLRWSSLRRSITMSTSSTIDVTQLVPEPSRLREAIARNMRERRALELALRAAEFVAVELRGKDGGEGGSHR